MSYFAADCPVSKPKFNQAWRDKGGIHATVYTSHENAGAFFFDSPQDARDMAAECIRAAEGMEQLEATPPVRDTTEGEQQ